MPHVVHNLRCVVCGLMARAERYGDGPYPPETREQTFGGSIKTPVGQRRHIGYMEWAECVPYTKEELRQMKRHLEAALEKVNEAL